VLAPGAVGLIRAMQARSSNSFRVTQPLVLKKTFPEHLKHVIKDTLSYFGVDIHDWGSYRKNYYKPGQMKDYLLVPRLAGETLADIVKYSDRVLKNYKETLSQIPDDKFHLSVEYQTVPLIRSVLDLEIEHHRAVEIGACYAKTNQVLSREYPNVTWDLLDFPETLEEENRDIKSDNMEFHSCYPLEFLESTERKYDVAVFNRTLSYMGRAQIAEYLKVLRNRSRYIVFGEPCRIQFEPGNFNMDAIHPDFPRCHGAFLVHNYRAVFEDAGFRLLHYDAQRSGGVNATALHFLIRGVAEPIT